ncbi:MAG: MATE family efflux transporter [Akkermansia sp.]|nr:MATE family efflux transporter [Akkermansia sp.]
MEKDPKLIALETHPVGRLLFQYSLPAIIGMAAMAVFNIVDSIYIGQCCNAYAIAAIALIFPLMNLVGAAGTLVGLGSAASASIFLGQQKFENAFRVLGNCLGLSCLLGILVGWVPLLWLDEILLFFGADENTLGPARDFTLVLQLGCPISYFMFNLNHLMRASGYPRKAMASLLIAMVVNIAAAHVFIYWLGWGMTGAGIATIGAQFVALAWILAHYCGQSHILHFRRGIYRPSLKIIRRICTVGMPPCLLNIVGCVIVVVFNKLLIQFDGQLGLAAFGIVNRVLFLFVMVVLGVTQGMQPIAGYNLGLGNYARVKGVLYRAIAAAVCITTVGWLLAELIPGTVAAAFISSDDPHRGELMELCLRGMRYMALVFPIVGSQIAIGNFFQSIGRPIMSIFLNLSRQCLVLLPCLLILPRFFEDDSGVWLSQAVSDGFCGVVSILVLRRFITHVLDKQNPAQQS